MIRGLVTPEGLLAITVSVGGFDWPATLDTGFNGDLELPSRMRRLFRTTPGPRVRSLLAGARVIEEDTFITQFPFDGEEKEVTVTFTSATEILIGTRLLRDHRLEVDFPTGTLLLERAAPSR